MASPFLSHLDTNYRPTDEETPAILNIIASARSATQDIDEQLKTVMKSIFRLSLARHGHLSSANKHAALLQPIRKVPDDILSAIFHACMPHNRHDAPMTREHPAIVVSHVCQHWRHLSLLTPSLWAEINLVLPEYPTSYVPSGVVEEAQARWKSTVAKYLAAGSVWIERSAEYPLSITFLASQPDAASDSINADSGFWAGATASLDMICGVAHRWKAVQINICTVDSRSHVGAMLETLLSLKADSVPLLETLWIGFVRTDGFFNRTGDSVLVPHINIIRTDSLRSLRLDSIAVPWSTLPVQWPALTELRISPMHIGPGSVNPGEVLVFGAVQALALLRSCPNLSSCDLTLSLRHPGVRLGDGFTDGIAVLPNLKHLTIRGPLPGEGFIDLLNLPSLVSLSLTCPISDGEGHNSGTLLAWMGRLGHQLKTITLTISALNENTTHTLLNNLPNLHSLDVKYRLTYHEGIMDDCEESLLTRLLAGDVGAEDTPGGEKVCLCPHLRDFACNVTGKPSAMTEAGLLEMIASRRVPGGRVAMLGRVKATFGTLKTVDIRDELERRGVDVANLEYEGLYASRLTLRPSIIHGQPMAMEY